MDQQARASAPAMTPKAGKTEETASSPPQSPEYPPPRDHLVAGSPYNPIRQIAGGGEGEIWEAEQTRLGRLVALKRLRQGEDSTTDSAEPARELQIVLEARLSAALEHPNILPVHDLVEDPATRSPMIAMKRVFGKSWSDLLLKEFGVVSREEYLSRHLDILVEVAQAVAFAHSRGIVHRDIKPSQVMLGEFGEVLLVDWGLAVSVDPARLPEEWAPAHTPVPPTIDTALNPCGTPAFMAPEQSFESPDRLGPWTDVYLLGATLYCVVTGHPPHRASTPEQSVVLASRNEVVEWQPSSDDPLPEGLVELMWECLNTEPEERPPATQFLSRLCSVRSGYAGRTRSVELIEKIEPDLASGNFDYEKFAAIQKRLDEARTLWPGNPALSNLDEKLNSLSAEYALGEGDLRHARVYAVALSDSPLRASLLVRIEEEEKRQAASARQKRIAFAAATFLFVISIAAALIAHSQKLRADDQLKETRDAIELALKNEQRAKESEDAANIAREAAVLQQYYANVALVDTVLDDARPDIARNMLVNEMPEGLRNWEWGALVARLAQDDMTLTTGERAAGGGVSHGEWSYDGQKILTGHYLGDIRIWDAESGRLLASYHYGGYKDFRTVRLSPDGSRILGVSTNGKALIADFETGVVQVEVELPRGDHEQVMWSGDFISEGALFVTTGEDGNLHVWDSETGDLVRSVEFGEPTYAVRNSPGGGWIAVGLRNRGQAHIVDVNSFNVLEAYTGHEGDVLSVCFSPDKTRLATTCEDGRVRIYKAGGGGWLLQYFETDEAAYHSAAFNHDSSRIAVSGSDGTCHIWDTETGALLMKLTGTKEVEKVALHPTRDVLLTISSDEIRKWDLDRLFAKTQVVGLDTEFNQTGVTGNRLRLPVRTESAISPFSDYGRFVLAPAGRTVLVRDGGVYFVDSPYSAFAPDSSIRAEIGRVDSSLRVYQGSETSPLKTLLSGGVSCAAFNSDGTRLGVGLKVSRLLVYDTRTWEPIVDWNHPNLETFALTALEFDKDSSGIACGWQNGGVSLFDLSTKKPRWIASQKDAHVHGKPVGDIAFSPNGERIVSASSDERGLVWDARSGRRISELKGHGLRILTAEFTSDGSRVLTTSKDNKAKIWDVLTGREVMTVIDIPSDQSLMAGGFTADERRAWFVTVEGEIHEVEAVPWRQEAWECAFNDFSRCLEQWKRSVRLGPWTSPDDIGWQ